MRDDGKKSYYGGRPVWQWILIYVVIGLIVYGLIYYFILSRRQVTPGAPLVDRPGSPPVTTQTPFNY